MRGVVCGAARRPDRIDVDAALAELVQRELVRPAPADFAGERGYRFTHILVRDAAYDLIPKRRRADLHVGFAEWLRAATAGRLQVDEIIGYHLEQAYGYRRQLGRVDASPHRALAADASGHLSAAGRRVLDAGDRSAAANLLARAVALRPADDPERPALLIDLGGVLREEGRFVGAQDALAEARAARRRPRRRRARGAGPGRAAAGAAAGGSRRRRARGRPPGRRGWRGRWRRRATTPAWPGSGTCGRCSRGSGRRPARPRMLAAGGGRGAAGPATTAWSPTRSGGRRRR